MMCLPMCISSCIPDDTPDKGNAIVCINTASLCEKLGIADLVAGMLAEKASFKITDSVLVYDRQGQLVARQGAESSSLQTVTIHLSDIPQGTYTLVAWQTTTTGTEPFWLLMESEQLATAHIVQLYPSTISSFRAIGLYTTTVTIGSEAATVQAEIEPMGSVVDLIIDGLTPECDYGNVSLAVGGEDPAVEGFYLNPAHSGEDRWVFSDNRTEGDRPVGAVIPSSPENRVFTLSHGEDKTFGLYAVDKTTKKTDSLIDAEFTLEPGIVATFYYDLDKTGYQPPYCGLTEGFAAWKAERDAGILVTDPCFQWGADLQTVHNHVASHQLWWKVLNEELELEEGHGWGRWYCIAKDLYEYYNFETGSGNNLQCAICICLDPDVPSSVAFTSLIKQGYEYKGGIIFPDQPDVVYAIFFSADGQTEVMVNEYEAGGWQIFYQLTDPDDLPLIIPAVG